jgi:hypothetical protein
MYVCVIVRDNILEAQSCSNFQNVLHLPFLFCFLFFVLFFQCYLSCVDLPMVVS